MSGFGASRGLVCPSCGMRYDDLRAGLTFTAARRDIIAIGVDAKTGRTKYGRRNGTLGHMHQMKMLQWRAHVDECVAAYDVASSSERRGIKAAATAMRDELRAKRKAATKIASRAWHEREKAKRRQQLTRTKRATRNGDDNTTRHETREGQEGGMASIRCGKGGARQGSRRAK